MRPAARPSSNDFAPAIIRLHKGQSCQLWCGRDAVLLLQSGKLHLQQAPTWLGDVRLDLHNDLQEGQHCQLERSGWVRLEACQESELWHYAAPQSGAALMDLLRRIGRLSVNYLRRTARQLLA